ncbi:hypothetical protein B0H12DRAFT_1089939 [Mycena haematopus]|nr:hypothetical protein B0H12DRAFT_1089939 [Mycena haematopus]
MDGKFRQIMKTCMYESSDQSPLSNSQSPLPLHDCAAVHSNWDHASASSPSPSCSQPSDALAWPQQRHLCSCRRSLSIVLLSSSVIIRSRGLKISSQLPQDCHSNA